eukprot:COSAG01_NODE_6974_length_3410_cov_2.025672_5_plen_103_part_00
MAGHQLLPALCMCAPSHLLLRLIDAAVYWLVPQARWLPGGRRLASVADPRPGRRPQARPPPCLASCLASASRAYDERYASRGGRGAPRTLCQSEIAFPSSAT